MLNGLKNRFHQLRYGDERMRRKLFWILVSGIFALVVIAWIFSGWFLKGINFSSLGPSSIEKFSSVWGDVKNNAYSAGSQIKNSIENLVSSTASEISTST